MAGRSVDRVSLLNNAFIITQEDSLLFDQIKGTEVMAYFDTTGALKRFDALGGASAIFFLQEKEAIATVNKVETKMMSALFKDGDLDQVYYFDSPKNDAYPIPQLKNEDRSLKGFNWQIDIQPKGKADITDLTVRPSERAVYESRPRAQFRQTNIFFPGYMNDVYRSLEDAKRRREERRRQQEELKAREEAAAADTLSAAVDSLAVPADSLAVPLDSLAALADSLSVPADSLAAVSDSLHAVADSLSAGGDSLAVDEPVLDERALKKAEWERKKAERDAAREAKWARLDSLDAAKAAAKLAKKEARKKAKLEKQLKRIEAQNERDRKKLKKYVEMYRRRKAREDARAAAKAAKAAAAAAAAESEALPEAPADDSGTPGSETPDETTLKTIDDGKDSRQVPPLREGGHPEQRGLTDSTLDQQTAEPPETSLQRTE